MGCLRKLDERDKLSCELNEHTIISAYRGRAAIAPPATIAVLPKTAVTDAANNIAVHGELIVEGNCNAIKIVTTTKQATAKNARLNGFCCFLWT